MLVRPHDGGFYLLDELGALIWDLCDGSHTVDTLVAEVAEVAERRGAEPQALTGEVREWIAELRVEQLLLPCEGGVD